jgi:methionyl-tRNA formyltransferase
MKIIFFGTPEFAVPSLEKLLATPEIEVVGIVTQPDRRRGRGNQLSPSPIKAIALQHQIPLWQPEKIKKDPEVLEQLQNLEADFFAVVAYGQILSTQILEMPKLGCINVHGSLLPEYRGAAPIQWCLYHGAEQTGITTMLMDQGMDTGAMLLKKTIDISLETNASELAIALSTLGADLLLETLHTFPQITPISQETNLATYAPLIKKTDYVLDWGRSAIDLHNQIRGFAPHCTTTLGDQILKIIASLPLGADYWSQLPPTAQTLAQADIPSSSNPGEIVFLAKNLGIVVQTGSGCLLITKVQPPGKGSQSAWDFANGNRLQIGTKLS